MNKLKFEDLKNMNYGDQIIFNDLMGDNSPYVLINIDNTVGREVSYYFTNGGGASMVIKDQKTIDAFNVKQIGNTHPVWDQTLSDHGIKLGRMMNLFIDGDTNAIEQFVKNEL
jgi:hypothetical protein